MRCVLAIVVPSICICHSLSYPKSFCVPTKHNQNYIQHLKTTRIYPATTQLFRLEQNRQVTIEREGHDLIPKQQASRSWGYERPRKRLYKTTYDRPRKRLYKTTPATILDPSAAERGLWHPLGLACSCGPAPETQDNHPPNQTTHRVNRANSSMCIYEKIL